MPKVIVLGGVNGSGKTTIAHDLLSTLEIRTFVNADTIARGLNGLAPETEATRAGRVMLTQIRDLVAKQEDFSFETTLAARTYAPWLRDMRVSGYEVGIVYCWLESASIAVDRVAERVRSGGHSVPEADIRRRYYRATSNFLNLYMPLANWWEVWNNTSAKRKLLAIQYDSEMLIESQDQWDDFLRSADEGDTETGN